MFRLIDIIKYLTFISYIGFIISGISGFVEVSNTFMVNVFAPIKFTGNCLINIIRV